MYIYFFDTMLETVLHTNPMAMTNLGFIKSVELQERSHHGFFGRASPRMVK